LGSLFSLLSLGLSILPFDYSLVFNGNRKDSICMATVLWQFTRIQDGISNLLTMQLGLPRSPGGSTGTDRGNTIDRSIPGP